MSFEEWKEVRLGDIAHVQTGPFGSQLHQRDYKECGTPIITVEHLGDNRIIHANTPFVSDEDKERLKKYILHQGDIVFSRVGSVDRRALVRKREEGWLFSGRCLRVRVTDPEIDSEYLSYYFGLESFKEYVRRIAVGATMPSLNTKILSNIKVRIPDFVTQKNIVKMLSPFDEKIELNNQINKNLEEMAQAIFKSWFVDFEPFQDGEFVESELGLIPKGWEVGNFNKLVSELIGGDWGKEEPQKNHQQKVYCIRGADIPEVARGNKGKIPVRYILEKNALKKSLKSGDIVIEISGGSPTQSTGRAVLINDELLERFDSSLICTNFCRVIKLKEDYYSNFVYLYLKYLYEKEVFFQFENGTTGIKNLDINSFLEVYQIVIPSKEILNKFNNLVDKCFSSIQQLGKENEILSNLRDTLLPKLMSGEIRVPLENEGRHQDEQLQ